MPKPMDSAADAFVAWVQTQEVKLDGLVSFDAAVKHPLTADLAATMSEIQPSLPIEALALLVTSAAQLQAKSPVLDRHYRSTGVDFVAVWALASPVRVASTDPNEQRFYRWARAESWENLYEAGVIGVRVLMTYRRPFDLRTLFNWVAFRASEPASFSQAAEDSFSVWQTPVDWVPEVDASRHDSGHCRAIVEELLAEGWKRESLAERLGVTPQYLGLITRQQRSASYGLQVALELLRGPTEETVLKAKPASRSAA